MAPHAGSSKVQDPAGALGGFASVVCNSLKISPPTSVTELTVLIRTRPPWIRINFPTSISRNVGLSATSVMRAPTGSFLSASRAACGDRRINHRPAKIGLVFGNTSRMSARTRGFGEIVSPAEAPKLVMTAREAP